VNVTARPFLKWVGGKSQLLNELTRRLPSTFRRYYEPFLGGGALFFHLYSRGLLLHGAVLSDLNPELIDTYRAVRDHTDELIRLLNELQPYGSDSDTFYQIRSWDRQPGFAQRPLVERAARTLFLNRTCYNGLYRLNSKGQFNAPFGRYRRPRLVDVANLRAAARALQPVELRVADFTAVLDTAHPTDLIYFDPPYVPLSGTSSFTAYTGSGFDHHAQLRLAETFRALAERGCNLLLSNSNTELSRSLYQARCDIVLAGRRINCVAGRRGPVEELIAVHEAP
jgi:DNA adenine methylase